MDILFHALTGISVMQRSSWWLAAIFGALPDIIGLGGALDWRLYLFSHGIIAILLVFLIILVAKLQIELLFFYSLHILLDIFFHASGTSNLFYPWPDPIGYTDVNWWSSFWIEVIAYSILIIVVVTRIFFDRRKNK